MGNELPHVHLFQYRLLHLKSPYIELVWCYSRGKGDLIYFNVTQFSSTLIPYPLTKGNYHSWNVKYKRKDKQLHCRKSTHESKTASNLNASCTEWSRLNSFKSLFLRDCMWKESNMSMLHNITTTNTSMTLLCTLYSLKDLNCCKQTQSKNWNSINAYNIISRWWWPIWGAICAFVV